VVEEAAGMLVEAGNRRKSPVTLAVTAGYFFSLKKIMRENLVSAIQHTVHVSTDQHVEASFFCTIFLIYFFYIFLHFSNCLHHCLFSAF
jgi:hypothetical protein